MKQYIQKICLLFIFLSNTYAQDSLNCRLLTTSGDLVRAYCLAVQDDYIFCGMHNEFTILEASDIYNLNIVYKDTLEERELESIVVKDSLVFLGTDEGLLILNVTDINRPEMISKLATKEHIVRVFLKDTYAYLGTINYAFLMIDISDPANPFEIGRVDENIDDCWGFDVKDSLLFVASEDTDLKIFNITDPANILEVANVKLEYGSTASGVKVNGDVVYVSRPCTCGLYAFDISDLDNIKQLDYLENAGGHSIIIEDNYIYTSGSNVIDISDPANLKLVGKYFQGGSGYDIFVRDKIMFIPGQTSIYFIEFLEPITSINKDLVQYKFNLSQNYPNPFNPTTTINYELPVSNKVTLTIYDVLGREIKTLVSKKQTAGKYKVTFDASAFSSGIYYYTLKTDQFKQSRKMVLLK